jgi:hypothetical protein
MSSFHNLSTNQIADDYGALKLQAESIEARLKDLKAELIKRDVTSATGARFAVTVSEQSATRLDTKALKEALGESICAEFEKTSMSIVVRVKAVAAQLAEVA